MKIKIKRDDADATRTVFIKSSQQGLNVILNEYGVKPMQLSDLPIAPSITMKMIRLKNKSILNNFFNLFRFL